MTNNTFSKTSIIGVYQRKSFLFWRLQCTKKLRNSPLCPREWSSITNGSFLRFFPFLLPFRNSIMPNNTFSKLNNCEFFNEILFFFEDCNVPKNCEILHFVHGSEAQSQMEVFFGFFSFYYRLGKVSCQITLFQNSVIGVFQRNFILFLKIAMYQKIAKFSTLSTGVKLNHKCKFYWMFFYLLLPFRNSIMTNNTFSKISIIWVYQRKSFLFWRLQCTKTIAKFSTLSTGVKLNHKWKFSSIFSLFITI